MPLGVGGELFEVVRGLGGAGLGEFQGQPQVDRVQDRVEPGVAGVLGEPVRRA